MLILRKSIKDGIKWHLKLVFEYVQHFVVYETLLGLPFSNINTLLFFIQGCVDNYDKCAEWSRAGVCSQRPEFMSFHCRESCGTCGFKSCKFETLIKFFDKREEAMYFNNYHS